MTQAELERLQNNEKATELSALNAIVKLLGKVKPFNVEAAVFTSNNTEGNFQEKITRITFLNQGASDAAIFGNIIKPNQSITFDAGPNNYFEQEFQFDSTGTSLLISYTLIID